MADLDLKPEEINALRGAIKIHGLVRLLVWPMMMANTMDLDSSDGRSQTILAPRALHHGGLLADEQCLVQMAAHELVHHAQDEARGGTVLRTFFPQHRGFTLGGRLAMVEGHAHWVDQQVTTRLFGQPVDAHQRARRSWRHRLHSAMPGIRRFGPGRDSYVQGAQLIEHAVAAGGTDLVNRVWKDTSLLPSQEEITDPDAWIRRIAF
ncbi:zinc-dependent metalloprotease [Streptomyces galilaeus]|uniref:zinc-dependent metalloprotease n=1 Tax=Streptomyces galilaeus TaxID=33899 RepID=UPI0038F6BC1F